MVPRQKREVFPFDGEFRSSPGRAFLIVSGPLKEYGDNILFASASIPEPRLEGHNPFVSWSSEWANLASQ